MPQLDRFYFWNVRMGDILKPLKECPVNTAHKYLSLPAPNITHENVTDREIKTQNHVAIADKTKVPKEDISDSFTFIFFN